MQKYTEQFDKKSLSNLAKIGASILESNVKPFIIDKQPIVSSKNSIQKKSYPRIINANYNPSALINKLTLKRLRKMQALVRGFLVRRITYPRLLKRYKICLKVYEDICKNCILEESSSVVMQVISQNKVNKDLEMQSKSDKIVFSLTHNLLTQFIQQMSKQVIATCFSDNIQKKNPQIKALTSGTTQNIYQLNLPEERLAKQIIHTYIDKISQKLAKEIIKQTVDEMRIQKLADEYILQQVLMQPIIEQLYQQYMQQINIQQITDQIINRNMEEFTNALVKYETKRYTQKAQEEEIKQAQAGLIDLMIGEQLLVMLCNQQ